MQLVLTSSMETISHLIPKFIFFFFFLIYIDYNMQVLREISVKKRRHEISQHPNSGTSFLPRHSLSLCSPHEQVDHACCLADPFRSSRGKKSMSTSRATGSLHCPRFYILKNMITSLHFLHLIPTKFSNIFRNQVAMIRGKLLYIF